MYIKTLFFVSEMPHKRKNRLLPSAYKEKQGLSYVANS